MPALPNVPNVLKVILHYSDEGDPKAETVHHVQYSGGPPSAANCTTMANSILASAGTNFAALMADSVSVTSVQITDLTTPTTAQAVSTGSATTGTRGTTLLPPSAAALVNHTINRRYRGGKPRSYFPFGISSDIQTTGLWTSAFLTAVNSGYSAWQSAVLGEGAGCTLTAFVNVSYYSGFTAVENTMTGRWRNVPKLRATPLVDTITGSATATKIGSQRRRNKDA
jgi:hypothetical protein